MKGYVILSLLINAFVNPASVTASGNSSPPASSSPTNSGVSKGIFNPSTATLPNGLEIVLIENHLAPIVSISLIYKVGTADDPEKMHGLSHFLEHLMFKGTRDIPADQFKKIISSQGGIINAYTTPDLTAYTCDISIEFLDFYLKLEADRMQNLIMDAKEVAEEQKVVQEERRMRLENNPYGLAYEALLRSTFWYHPYGIPAIGYPQHIAAYTPEAAYAHYKKWYVPNNAILVVAGDTTMAELKPMVEKHFASIPAGTLPERQRIMEPGHAGLTAYLEEENPRIGQVNVDWIFAAPNHRGANSKHYYPLIVLAQLLGGNSTSRLYRTLVEDQGIAVDANCHYDNDGYDPEMFSFSSTLAPDQNLETLKLAVEDHITDVVENNITATELANAKRDLLASLAFARDGNGSSVMTFSRLAVGFTVEQIEDWPNCINAVTIEQVNAAAKEVLSRNPVTVMTVYPQGYRKKARDMKKEKLKNQTSNSQVTTPLQQ
jgi:zinc protease